MIDLKDGGVCTVKSTVHDDFRGENIWPRLYDGRAIVGKSYEDYASGLSIEEIMTQLKAAEEVGDTSRTVTWW